MSAKRIFQSKSLFVLASLALATGLLVLSLVLMGGSAQAHPADDGGAVTGIDSDLGGGGGPSWMPTGGPMASGGQVLGLAVHPAISGTVYAAVAPIGAYDSGPSVIYKTTDGAATWTPVYTAEHQVYALAVTGTNVYAGAFNPDGEGPSLYLSQDSGVNWTPAFSSTDRGVWLDISLHPTDTDVAIIGGWFYHDQGEEQVQSGLVYRTDDAGMTWTPILTATFANAEAGINAVMIHPVTPTLMLASAHTWGGTNDDDSYVFRSEDGGATWPVSDTISNAHVTVLAANPNEPKVLYAGTGGSTFTGGPDMVFRSTDVGLSWTAVLTEAGGRQLALVPPNTVYAVGGCDDVFSSTSGGDPETWSKMESPDDCIQSFTAGMMPGVLYAGGEQNGVFKSTDGSATWEARNNGMQAAVQPRDIDVDPQNLDKMFVAADCSGGWMTADGGKTWAQVSDACMGAFAINPEDSDIVYGGEYNNCNGAVIRSDDGGQSFAPVYTATFILPDGSGGNESIYALTIAPSISSTVYAAGEDSPAEQPSYAVVLRTLDDGKNWTEVFTRSNASVQVLAIDPADDNTVYAGGEDCSGPDCVGFIYHTSDGGDNWTLVFTSSNTVNSIVIDPQKPDVLYAADDGYNVYKSTDGGDTWFIVRDPSEDPSGNLLAIDPHLPSHVYLGGHGYIAETTDGGQTWSEWEDPINNGVPEMEPRALAVDNGTVTQTLYAGFSGVWAYRRLAPQEGTRYVATTGSDDANPCVDPESPCRTVAHALEMANAGESVLVAQGTYTENLNISKPVTLTGGYEAVNWTRDLTQYETIIDGSGSQTVPGDWDSDGLGTPRVISDSGQYRMWYEGRNLTYPNWGRTLGLAESPDGLNWTKYGDNPILEPGDEGEWDSMYRGQVAMMKDGGLYKMWYSGSDGGPWQTGYATSTNGIAWNIYTGNPVLPIGGGGSWDEQEANGPTVIKDGGLYQMWYHGCNPDYTICSIGYATSTSGLDWSKHAGNPVLTGTEGEWDEGTALWPSVVKDGSTYKMWYYGGGGKVGLATSPDGVNWTKHAGNPVLTEGWDGVGVRGHMVMLEGGTYRMWFRSGADNNIGIGFAESTDGISWTLSISNPVLTPGTPTQWGDPVVRFEEGSDGAVLDGFTITGGNVGQDGGGITIGAASPIIQSCVIQENTAQGQSEWGGGGILIGGDSSPIISGTIIMSNTASGGAGGVRVDASFTMINSLVVSNTGRSAIHANSASMTLTNVTIADHGPEGGILLNNSQAIILNSIVWEDMGPDINAGGGSSYTITYSDVEDEVLPGTGNISADPQFVDAANGDYHLQPDSPCVDTGTNTGAPDHDFEGDARPFAYGVDMGADEWWPMLSVTLSADQAGEGPPGADVTYVFTVTNNGDYTDTFGLEVSGVWTPTLDAGITSLLASGGSSTVALTVTIPPDAVNGASDVATLAATSGWSTAVSDSALTTTTARWHKVYLPIILKNFGP